MNLFHSPLKGSLRSRLIVIGMVISAIIVGIIFAISQLYRPRPIPINTPTLKTVTAFFPLSYFAKAVMGKNGVVETLIPPGVDIHSYSPSAQDIQKALSAEIFFTLNFEPSFLEKPFFQVFPKKNTIIVVGEGVSFLNKEEEDEEEYHEDEKEDHHHEEPYDIHIWLSPRNAIRMVENIEKGISAYHAKNSIVYRAQSREFIALLQELDEDFKNTLTGCQKDIILVTHNAFSYLVRDYGFKVLPLYSGEKTDLDVGTTPARVIQAIKMVKKYNVKYLFYTSEANTRVTKTIAEEIKVRLVPLYTLENRFSLPKSSDTKVTSPHDYISTMRENLGHLALALECPQP